MLATVKNDVKGFFSTKVGKGTASVLFVLMISAFMTMPAFAATGTADTAIVDSMSGSFADVKATALAALSAIGAIAILLFAGVYAWKYGKKVFQIVAR